MFQNVRKKKKKKKFARTIGYFPRRLYYSKAGRLISPLDEEEGKKRTGGY